MSTDNVFTAAMVQMRTSLLPEPSLEQGIALIREAASRGDAGHRKVGVTVVEERATNAQHQFVARPGRPLLVATGTFRAV